LKKKNPSDTVGNRGFQVLTALLKKPIPLWGVPKAQTFGGNVMGERKKTMKGKPTVAGRGGRGGEGEPQPKKNHRRLGEKTRCP